MLQRLIQANLANKSNTANFVNQTDFYNKLKDITSNKNALSELSKKVEAKSTKGLTRALIDKFRIHNGAKHFSSGTFQNYLVFIPAKKYMRHFHPTTRIYSWKSNGMSEESIENITKSESNFAPTFIDHHFLPDMNFNGHCLTKNNISILEKVINHHVSYTWNPQSKNLNIDFALGNCLFESVKLTKNADLDKYKYTGYGVGFDLRSEI